MQNKIYYRVYVDNIKNLSNPLIAQLGIGNWATLCVLASFADENNQCYPAMGTIALLLGVDIRTVKRYIKSLSNIVYEGEKLVTVSKIKLDKKVTKNVYTLNSKIMSIF